MRTNKALGPSQCSQVFDTSSLGAKAFLKFDQSPWIIFLHEEEHYILWSLESSAYPSKFIGRVDIIFRNVYISLREHQFFQNGFFVLMDFWKERPLYSVKISSAAPDFNGFLVY